MGRLVPNEPPNDLGNKVATAVQLPIEALDF